ncbi:MAG: RNA methyltransferase [Pseudomonadota bacterium]
MNAVLPLESIRIVLVETSHPGNIGSAARAMKTMGINRLFLVKPKIFPNGQTLALASGALDVVSDAVICTSLDDALAGTTLAVAVTARRRDLSHPGFEAREVAVQAVAATKGGEVALVFGTEMSGLSNEDVLKCQRLAHIPANPDYSSLNLAAAVQVICYELRMAAGLNELSHSPEVPLATFEENERLYQHLEQTLTEIRFLNPDHPKRLMIRIRRMFTRIHLEREEVQILRGVLKMISRAVRRDAKKTM